MSSNPDQSHRQQEEATALLMLGAGYSLPQLIRNARVRPKPFRRIEATEALRSDLASPYFDLLQAWHGESATLLAVYASVLPDSGMPLGADAAAAILAAVDRASDRIRLAQLEQRFPGILARLDRWQRKMWLARIRAATRLDVSVLTSERAGAHEVANAVTRNEQLMTSLHEETKNRLGAMMTNALMAFVPVAAVSAAYARGVDQGKPRAARIAVDQTDMLTEALSRVRRREAGLARFRWHHTPQLHPRLDHRARDMRVYSHSNAPNDRAGTLPFCKCYEEPLWD